MLRGEKFTYAADVWSFGVILLEMVTAEEPYKDMSGIKVAMMVRAAARHPVSVRHP